MELESDKLYDELFDGYHNRAQEDSKENVDHGRKIASGPCRLIPTVVVDDQGSERYPNGCQPGDKLEISEF